MFAGNARIILELEEFLSFVVMSSPGWQLTKDQRGKCLIEVNLILFPNRRSRGIEASPTQTTFFGDDKKSAPLAPPKRAVLKALKMSVIHVAFFILSWTPYTVIGTW